MGDITQKEKNQALIDAIDEDDLEGAKRALELGADPNAANVYRNVLHEACFWGYIDIAKALVSCGADVNRLDIFNNVPLVSAITSVNLFKNSREILQFLIDAGADVNIVMPNGMTPLHYAVMHHRNSAVKILLQAGADINIRHAYTYACKISAPLHQAVQRKYKDTVRILLDAGADTEIKNQNNETPLIAACFNPRHKKEIIENLLAAGADPDTTDRDGNTSLMLLAVGGYTGMMRTLLSFGADIHIKNKCGDTALDMLKEYQPYKYEVWIRHTLIVPKRKMLAKEDSIKIRERSSEPDFCI